MGLTKKSIIDIQCDSCDASRTLEGEKYAHELNEAGWRTIHMSIDPISDSDQKGHHRALERRFLCQECMTRVKALVRIYEGDGEAELAKLKGELSRAGAKAAESSVG